MKQREVKRRFSRRGFLALLAAAPAAAPAVEPILRVGMTLQLEIVNSFKGEIWPSADIAETNVCVRLCLGDYVPGSFQVPQNPGPGLFAREVTSRDHALAEFDQCYRDLLEACDDVGRGVEQSGSSAAS